MPKLHIQFTLFSAFYSPLISTMTGNFLAKEGFEYEWRLQNQEYRLSMRCKRNSSGCPVDYKPGLYLLGKGREPKARHFALINNLDGFFLSGRQADNNFSWSSLEGADVIVHHGGQPMTMFKYACHKAGIDISKINIIDAGNAGEMDTAFRLGKADYIHQQGPAAQQLESDGLGHVLTALGPLVGPGVLEPRYTRWIETEEEAFAELVPSPRICTLNTSIRNSISASIISKNQRGCFGTCINLIRWAVGLKT